MRYFPQVTVQIEERVPADVRAALAAKGHALRLEGEWNAVVGAPRRRAARSLSIRIALDRHRPSAIPILCARESNGLARSFAAS